MTDDAEGADEGEEWSPEPASLRDGETPDETAHASRNAALVRSGREILDEEEEEEADSDD